MDVRNGPIFERLTAEFTRGLRIRRLELGNDGQFVRTCERCVCIQNGSIRFQAFTAKLRPKHCDTTDEVADLMAGATGLATSCVTGRRAPAVGLDEFLYKFGWLQGTENLFTRKNN